MRAPKFKILVVSNGHGEDQIAAAILRPLMAQCPTIQAVAIPLVGKGMAFSKLGILVLGENPSFPSGGFIRGLWDLLRDLRAGLLPHLFRNRRIVGVAAKSVDLVICVGDVFCLLNAPRNPARTIFIATAKSDLIAPHSRLEMRLMQRWSDWIVCRDSGTAQSLQSNGLNGCFLGNFIRDLVVVESPQPMKMDWPMVLLVPGSRDEAIANFAHMMKVVFQVKIRPLTWVLAKADVLPIEAFMSGAVQFGFTWEGDERDGFLGAFVGHDATTKIYVTSHFSQALQCATVVLGLAGTANEQAVYVGKPVICFEGFGPQSTMQRFQEQKRLLGEGLTVLSTNDVQTIADALLNQLRDPNVRPVVSPGGMATLAIADAIVTRFTIPQT